MNTTNESGHKNVDSNDNSETPRRNISMCGNDNVDDKSKISPKRTIDVKTDTNRRQAPQILHCDEKDDAQKVKRRHKRLVQKYHPNKWYDVCDFDRVTGASMF